MNAHILHLSNSVDAPKRPNQVVSTTVVDENKIDDFLKKYYDDDKDHPYILVKDGILPCEEDPNGMFPTAWIFDDNNNPTKILIDLDEVKRVHMNRIRTMRNYSLKAWDEDHNIAMYRDDEKTLTSIKNAKQELRDVPSKIESSVAKAESIAEVISCVPEELSFNVHKKIVSNVIKVPVTDELQEL